MRSHFPRGSRSFCFGVALAAGLLAPGATSAQVFDFDNMVLLARRDLYTGYNDVWGFVGNDGHEYVIQGTTTGTAWWDIDDPQNPVHVKFIPGAGSLWRDMFTIGDYCYVGTEGGGGIQIIDISDPTDPTLVNTYTATVNRCHNVFGDPDRHLVFVIGGFTTMTNGGVQILDATDPVNLVEIGRWDNQYIHDLSVENDKMYVCLINTGRFRIIDYTDATNPTNFGSGWLDPTGSVHASWPVGDGQYVMIAEETTGGKVKKLDISNPNAIFAAAEHNPAPQASPHNVHVQGDKTYVSWYARGTRVLDNDLNELGYWDTYPDTNDGGVGPGNWGVYPHLPSGVIAANDGKYGLFLLRYDPDAAVFDGTISSSAGPFVGAPEVELIGYGVTQETESYRFSAFPGAAQIRASAFGHVEQTVNVSVGAGGTTTTNITLTKLPSGGVSGTITDSVSHLPLADVEVALTGTPVSVTTDGTGAYSFPDVPSGAYTLTVARYGYDVPAAMPLTISTGVLGTLDVELDPAFHYEDFATPVGWTVQSDPTTTSGFWVFGEPFGTYQSGVSVQTETDHTIDPEDQCAVTGNLNSGSPGADDVDGGATRLFTPVYDLSGLSSPHVMFFRWYGTSSVSDAWQVHVTTNGGGTWDLIDTTTDNEAFWRRVDVDLTPIALGAVAVQFRFTAEDQEPGELVEGALDDFTIYDAASAATGVELPFRGAELALAQNVPNPFPASTRIAFSVPTKGHVVLSVYDVRGARVATLVDEALEAGAHAAEWNGRTTAGKAAAAGVYFYKLETKNETRTRKMTRLH